VAAVAKNMEERQEFLADIRARLEQAQTVQKHHYDKAHRDVSYKVDDWVLLRLRQCPVASLPQATFGKLKPRWEDVEPFHARYPAFQLEDELPLEEGRDVMSGRYDHRYIRRRRARDVRRAEERAAHTAGGGHDKWLR
jgi:hypothetical protein